MNEKDLINKLTELKRVKPDQNWVIFCRENLVRELGGHAALERSVLNRLTEKIREVGEIRKIGWLLGPAAVLAGIFILIFGNGLWLVSQAKTSLPGDRLYSVKIALEQAQLLVTPSQEGKTKIQNEIIVSRLAELDKVVNAGEPISSKQPKIEEAVSNLQKQLLTVKDELPKMENMEAKKVMEMAKKIDANASQAQESLNQAKLALSSGIHPALSEKISEVADEADKTSTKALEVMIKTQTEGNGEIHQEILAKLDERIQKTEDMKELLEVVNRSASSTKFSINAAIILDETDKAIEQAKLSLQNDDVQGALQTIKAAGELVKSAQKIVEAVNVSVSDNPPAGEAADKSNADKPVSDIPIVSDIASSTPSAATSTPVE